MNSNQKRFLYAAWIALTISISLFFIQFGLLETANTGGVFILVLALCGCAFAIYLWVHKNQKTIDKWLDK
ncbi:hypothetical protein KJ365_05200 [Glaciecola sp. XM2]|jgi:hypothetical protein|uniref:hypothetical protein n=1 Tax=Glaciecola sp. XM2 TaxID=1914931 RepID=UPI001BDF2C40|nr:hypothetical protein [Glaciecola sp. XM2]MBT1450269.1 hypothetical protein [Glaciecola sp. XM2]